MIVNADSGFLVEKLNVSLYIWPQGMSWWLSCVDRAAEDIISLGVRQFLLNQHVLLHRRILNVSQFVEES